MIFIEMCIRDRLQKQGVKAKPFLAKYYGTGGKKCEITTEEQANALKAVSYTHLHRLQRIGAHQLRKPLVVVCRGILHRLHFVQRHIYAASGQCPGGFAPGQSGPYYRNFTHYFALFS